MTTPRWPVARPTMFIASAWSRLLRRLLASVTMTRLAVCTATDAVTTISAMTRTTATGAGR
nr:hypothetical protein [Mycolicibacterium houstonense]